MTYMWWNINMITLLCSSDLAINFVYHYSLYYSEVLRKFLVIMIRWCARTFFWWNMTATNSFCARLVNRGDFSSISFIEPFNKREIKILKSRGSKAKGFASREI